MDDAAPTSSRMSRLSTVAVLFFIAALYALTLRDGHAWGGDNAMYVLHARNLLEGVPYGETGYIYNDASGRFPKSYPPVFPFLLVPLVAMFGVVWTPLKLATIACFVAALGFLSAHERARTSTCEGVAILALVGLNPILWDFKDNVFSEYPFLLFLCAALWLVDRSERKPQRAPGLGWGLCLGTLIYLAYGTRSTGALLLPALFGIDLLRGRFPKAPLWTAAASFSVLALLQNLFLHSESGHLFYKFSQLDLALPIHNLFVAYPELFHDFWRSQPPISALGFGVAALAAVALAAGLVQRARRRELDVLDGFVLVSLGFFLFIRLHDMNPPQRYWIPLFPLLVVQIIRGFAELPLPRRHLLLGGFSALALLGYATSYGPLEAHEVKKGITSADAREMYAYIRQHTQEDDTLIFFEPRVLTLYTGRPASELRTAGNREEWMRYAKEIGARYWIRPGGLPTDYQNTLSIVFSNETFSVFRFDAYR